MSKLLKNVSINNEIVEDIIRYIKNCSSIYAYITEDHFDRLIFTLKYIENNFPNILKFWI